MSKNDGGMAFPEATKLVQSYDHGSNRAYEIRGKGGMSLRDYFAAKAMAIIPAQAAYNMKPNESNEQYVARRAYEYADAMLSEREKA